MLHVEKPGRALTGAWIETGSIRFCTVATTRRVLTGATVEILDSLYATRLWI